jgi:hypothetical protein
MFVQDVISKQEYHKKLE